MPLRFSIMRFCAPAAVLAGLLFTPLAHAALFSNFNTDLQRHLNLLSGGTNPQVAIPASVSPAELTALCAVLSLEDALSQTQAGQLQRAITAGDVSLAIATIDCDGDPIAPEEGVYVPAHIVFSFSTTEPAVGDTVTVTATYTDPNGAPRRGHAWTVTNDAGTAVANTPIAVTTAATRHSTTFTMPPGSVSIGHTVESGNVGGGRATATRSTSLAVATIAPAVDAGADINALQGEMVTLSGTVSRTGGNGALRYRWRQVTADSAAATTVPTDAANYVNLGPERATTSGTTVTASFTAAVGGTLYFRLSGYDTDPGGGPRRSTTDTVTVTVAPVVADAGVDQNAARGASVALDGRASRNASGGTSGITFLWIQTADADATTALSPATVTLRNATTATPTFTAPAGEHTLHFLLTVTETARNAAATDRVVVRLDGVSPRVVAADDHRVRRGETLTLSVTVTRGPTGGGNISYEWQQVTADSPNAVPVAAGADNYIGSLPAQPLNPLSGSKTFNEDLTAPLVTVETVYYFRVTVRDTTVGINSRPISDIVAVTVDPVASAPTANAGANQRTAPAATVKLDGSASTNARGGDGGITFAWAHTDPAGVAIANSPITLNGGDTATPTFTAPTVTDTTPYYFQLTVTETINAASVSRSDIVIISVDPIAPPVNAGADQTTGVYSTQTVTLSGIINRPDNDNIASIDYEWQQVASDSVTATTVTAGDTYVGTINDASGTIPSGDTAANATFTAPRLADGTKLFFRLRGTASTQVGMHTNSDVVTISVSTIPTANAGTDQTTTTGTSVTLDGSASSASKGGDLTYAWAQTGGTAVTLSGDTTAMPTFTFTPPATAAMLVFTLTVTEAGIPVTDSDSVTVTIGPTPTVAAGDDQSVLEGVTVTLAGSVTAVAGSTADVQYAWRQTDAAGVPITPTVTFNNRRGSVATSGDTANQAHATFTAPAQTAGTATYHFRLRGHAAFAYAAFDSVTVTVRHRTAANAGPDQTIRIGNAVTLAGSGSGTDNTAANIAYAWAQSGGTATSHAVTLSDAAIAAPTFTFSPPSAVTVLEFTLTVTAANGDTATDTVAITIGPTPTVAAGGDRAVGARATVTLAGMVTPVDGDSDSALIYTWRQVTADSGDRRGTAVMSGEPGFIALTSGANGVIARSGATAYQARATFTAPNVTAPTVVYFRLRGSAAATFDAYDAIALTINPRPTADAGNDQHITTAVGVTLNGGASTNIAGVADSGITYSWAQTGATAVTHAVTLSGDATAMPTFTFAVPAAVTVLEFTLTVSEGGRSDSSDSDSVTVTIGPVPTVDAGADQVVGEGDTVTLSGTVTLVAGDTRLRGFVWRQVTADSGSGIGTPLATDAATYVALSPDATAPTATFIAPPQSGGGSTTYYFRLRGHSAFTYNAYDAVTVTVHDRPTAVAGDDAIVTSGNTIDLDGSASANAAGNVNSGITYAWAQTDSDGDVLATPTATFDDATAAAPTVTFTAPANEAMLHFRLTVTDTANMQTHSDTVSVTTGPVPTVDAGAALTVGSMADFTLRGTVTPPMGNISGALRYTWEETDSDGEPLTTEDALSQSGSVARSGDNAFQANVDRRAPAATTVTTRHYRLSGVIRYGGIGNMREYAAMDSVTVTIDPARIPTANAGADRTIGSGTSVTLDGSGSLRATDNVGGSLAYAWIQTQYRTTLDPLPSDNAAYVALTGANTAMPTFTYTPPAADTALFFLLTVTDSMTMLSATDRVEIIIGPLPMVDAGGNQTVREGATVTLDGTVLRIPGSSNRLMLTYTWEQVSDADGSSVVTIGVDIDNDDGPPVGERGQARATFTAPDVTANTDFYFRLIGAVNGFSTRQVITVTVRNRATGVPTANAGPDLTRTFGNSVTLTAAASTNAAGMNSGLTYAWAQIGDTATSHAVTLSDATAEMPTFTFTAPTTETLLRFRLTVTDTATTMTDSDRMSVLLGPTPMVDAGADATLREGALVTLMGTVTPIGGVGVLRYAWVQADAAGVPLDTPTVTIASAAGDVGANRLARATFTAPEQNTALSTTYYFRLRGHRAFQFNAYDSVAITVQDTPPAANRPTANAGVDINHFQGHSVTLDGSNSAPATSNAGGSIAYAWTQTADAVATAAIAPDHADAVTLSGVATAMPTFTFTATAAVRTLHFRLGVTDGVSGVTEFDRVTVTVGFPPTVDAGMDRTVTEGDTVTLAGSVTAVPNYNGPAVTSIWRQVVADSGAGPGTRGGNIAITAVAGTHDATFIAPEQGIGSSTYFFRLRGNAGIYSAFDAVAITVQNTVSADAGDDVTRTVGTTITLDGSGSTNAAGGDSGITYAWAQTGGTVVTLSGDTTAMPTFTFTPPPTPTTLHFRLSVTETATSVTDSDSVRITIGPTPTVDAGGNQTVDEGDTVTLSGTITAVAGSTAAVGYAWQQTDADGERINPPTITLSGNTSGVGTATSVTFTAPQQNFGDGAVYFRLRGHADFAYNAFDPVVITVRDSQNQPTANAGADVTRTFGTSVTLDGSASANAGGGVDSGITYAWAQTDNGGTVLTTPTVTLSDATVAMPTFTFTPPAMATMLHFRLTVTDDVTAATASDSVSVTIGPTPMVDAGDDPDPVNSGAEVTLSGDITRHSGAAASVINYLWTHVTDATGNTRVTANAIAISGATGSVAVGQTAAVATFTAPLPDTATGVYYFRLRGRADVNFAAFDVVAVTVNRPPTAAAGPDRTVFVGSMVTLDATASTSGAGAVNSGVTYEWEQTNAAGVIMPTPTVMLADETAASTTFTAPADAVTLYFTVTVTNTANDADASDRVVITVTNSRAPMVDAGEAQTVTEGAMVTLSGTLTPISGDTSALSYQWRQVTSATDATVLTDITITDASGSGETATATFMAPDITATSVVYYFQLTGTAAADSTAATVAITVNGKPTANAAVSDGVNLASGISVSLDGSGSRNAAGGSVLLEYLWIQTADADSTESIGSGIASGSLAVATFVTPSVRRGVETVYFLLTVTDLGNNETDTDRVQITVGQPPQVEAGAAQDVLAGATVNLSGTVAAFAGTTADSVNFEWTQVDADGAAVLSGPTLVRLNPTRGTTATAATSFTAPTPTAATADLFFRLSGQVTVGGQSYSGTDSVTITVDNPPTAAASPPARITSSSVFRLDGSASTDGGGVADGDITYSWAQTDAAGMVLTPPTVTITDAATAMPSVAYTPPTMPMTLHFLLTVTDSVSNRSDTARVSVTIGPTPTVNAGMDQTVVEGDTVTFDGTVTSVAGTTGGFRTLSWRWLQVAEDRGDSGDIARLQPGDTVIPLIRPRRDEIQTDGTTTVLTTDSSFTAPDVNAAVVTFYFQLRGWLPSNSVFNAFDTVAITVHGRPVAIAGDDAQVMTGAAVTLNGAASTDAAGNVNSGITYSWAQTDAAGTVLSTPTVTLANAAAASPTFTAPAAAGTLSFRLTVTDTANSRTDTDDVVITVGAVPTIAAGAAQTVREGAPVTLSGSVTRADGDTTSALSYEWTQVAAASLTAARVMSGDDGYIALSGASGSGGTATVMFTAPDVAVAAVDFHFLLSATATDAANNAAAGVPDIVSVTVQGAPTANAGPDDEQPATDGTVVLFLQGGASRNAAGGGGGLMYRWIQTATDTSTTALQSGDDNFVTLNIIDAASANAFFTVTEVVTLHFLLTVTDTANGQTDTDRVRLIFSRNPTVVVQTDAVAEGAMVTLRGAITRDAGDTSGVISYEWTQVTSATDTTPPANPIALTDASGTGADATATFIAPLVSDGLSALYHFQLTATTAGGSASNIAGITVYKLPTAEAGDNQQVALGASVTLDGSGSADGNGGDDIRYNWEQTGGTAVTLANAVAARPTFTAPMTAAVLHFTLSVAADADARSGVTATDTVTVTVGTPLSVSFNEPPDFAEGGMAQYTATLSGDTTRSEAVTVGWAVTGAAVAAADFCDGDGAALGALPSGSETIAVDASTATVTIRTCDDSLLENAEEFTVTFTTNGDGLSGDVHTDTVTITDNDAATVSIARSDSDGFTEGGVGTVGTAVFTVTVGGVTTADASVTFTVTGVDAADITADASPLTIAAGVATADISVTAVDDNAIEGDETVTVTVTAVTTAGNVTVDTDNAAADVVLSDDDTATVTVARNDDADGFTEGGSGTAGSTVFSVTLGGHFAAAVTVPYTISGVTADDIGASTLTGDFTIAANTLSDSITVTAADDTLLEGDETLSLALGTPTSSGDAPTVSGGPATAVLADADTASVAIARTDTDGFAEDGGTAVFTVTITGADTTAAASVAYSVTGTAAAADYTIAASPLSIAAGVATADITVTAMDDTLIEGDETVTVTVTGVTTAGDASVDTDNNSADATIGDDDATVAIARSDTDGFAEDGGTAVFTVTLGGTFASAVTVPFDISGVSVDDITATSLSGNFSVTADETTADLTVTAAADSVLEGDETVSVTITAPTVGGVVFTVTDDAADAVITDADSIIATLSGGDSVTEGDDAAVTVTLPAAPARTAAVVVTYTIGVDSDAATVNAAAADTDDSTHSGSITIAAADNSGVITIGTVDDSLNEAGEVFTVSVDAITTSGAITAAASPQSFTIADNDAIGVAIAADNNSVAEDGSVDFTVTLSGGTRTAAVTVPFTVSGLDDAEFNITAPAGIAASADSGSVTFGIADTSVLTATVTVDLLDDDLNEASETLTVTGGALSASPGTVAYTDGGMSDSVSVTDTDDITATFTSASTQSINEGASATIGVMLDHASATAVTVNYTITAGGDNVPGFSDSDSGSITIPMGMTSGEFTVTADSSSTVNSGSGTLTVAFGTVTAAGSASGSGTAVVTVNFRAFARTFAVTVDDTATAEGDTVVFTVSLSGDAVTANATVRWTIGGDVDANDYSAPSGNMLTFTSGNWQTPQTLSVTVTDDDVNEAAETLMLTLSNASGGGGLGSGLGTASATATVAASDPVTVSVSNATAVTEPDGTATVMMRFQVNLSATSAGAVTVPFSLGGTAMAGSDFVAPTLSVTVDAGQRNAELDITISGDDVNEAGETVTVTLDATPSVGSGGGTVTRATAMTDYTASGAINDNDAITATFTSASTQTIDEGATATIGVRLDHASQTAVTVNYTIIAGGGTAPAFTDSDSGSITIDANATSGEFTVTADSSTANSGSGTLSVSFGSVNAAGDASGSGTATVTVNFRAFARTFAVTVDDVNTMEGDTVTFTVRLSGSAPTENAMVAWTIGGDVTSGDYSTSDTTPLTFTSGNWNTAQTVTVSVTDDNLNEGAEALTLTLSNASGGGGIGTGIGTDAATATVAASDDITVTVSGGATVTEGGNAMVNLMLDAMPTSELTVVYAIGSTAVTTDVDAVAADTTAGSVTIASGATSGVITVGIVADNLNEAAEVFTVTVTDLSGDFGTTTVTGGAQTFTIERSDDASVTITAATAAIDETQTAMFTVTLSVRSAAAVTVPYTISGVSVDDISGDSLSGTVTINAGDTMARIAIGTVYDEVDDTETMSVMLGAITVGNGGGRVTLDSMASATVTVNNTAALRQLSVTGPSDPVAEGDEAEFVITLSGEPLAQSFTVAWTLSDDENNPSTTRVAGRAVNNHGGAHDFGGAARGTVNFDASNQRTQTRMVTVAVRDDALNEGRENLRLQLSDPCERGRTCTVGGGDGSGAPSLTLATAEATAAIPPSDPMEITLTRVGDGTLASGEAAEFVLSFGMTVVDGRTVPVVPSTDLTVPLTVMVGSASVTVPPVTVSAGAASATVTLPASVIAAQTRSGTPQLSVVPGTPTGTPTGATATPMATPVTAQVAGWVVTLSGPATVSEGEAATYTVHVRGTPAPTALTLMWAVSGSGTLTAADFGGATLPSGTVDLRAGTFNIATVDTDTAGEPDETFRVTLTASGADAMRAMLPDAVTTVIREDDPAARAVRLKTQVAVLARAAVGMTADMVRRRVNASGDAASLSIGGKTVSAASEENFAAASGAWAVNPFEREKMMRETFTVSGGEAMSAAEILRATEFRFSAADIGLNFWGGGGVLSASGDAGGASYDSDATAFHIGADTPWRDGVVGVALARASVEVNLNDAANAGRALDSRLDADLTGVHPYVTRRWNERARWWAMAGIARGDASLRESGTVARSGDANLDVLSAGFGAEFAARENLRLHFGALFSRASLDGGVLRGAGEINFVGTDANTMRFTGGAEFGFHHNWGGNDVRSFLSANLRRDGGDGDNGNTAEAGGGLEWRGDKLELRVEGGLHVLGSGAEENRFSLSLKKVGDGLAPYANLNRDAGGVGVGWTRGRLRLDVAVGVDDGGALRLRELLRGEVRF